MPTFLGKKKRASITSRQLLACEAQEQFASGETPYFGDAFCRVSLQSFVTTDERNMSTSMRRDAATHVSQSRSRFSIMKGHIMRSR
jgi:hypothetical protein